MTTGTKTTWKIDARHSEVQFRVTHLAISSITGRFRTFEGVVEREGDSFDNAKVAVTLDAASIDTNNPDRDKHLQSADFFNVENGTRIAFEGILEPSKEAYRVDGLLTIGAVTKPLVLSAELTGEAIGRMGDTRAGFVVTGKFSRKEFGLGWNILTEAGGLIIGDEIKLHFDIQVVKA